jgi:hypothetical protein
MSIRVPANGARHVAIAIAASVVCSSFADRAAAAVDFAKDIREVSGSLRTQPGEMGGSRRGGLQGADSSGSSV